MVTGNRCSVLSLPLRISPVYLCPFLLADLLDAKLRPDGVLEVMLLDDAILHYHDVLGLAA